MEWWIVIIVLASLALGGFTEWLKFKGKQEKLGASTSELESELQDLKETLREREQRQQALERRIQNLETIVTSESWDVLIADDEREVLTSGARLELPEDDATTEKAERIARRLRG